MSRVFFVDNTCLDIDQFIVAKRVKTDDILVWDSVYGRHYRLWGTKENTISLTIPEHVTERHEDALQYFSDAINQLEVELCFRPYNNAIAKRIGFIDDRVTSVIMNFSNRYAPFLRVKYGDGRSLLIKDNFQKCWQEQKFETVSSAIIDSIDSELDSFTNALFVTLSTQTIRLNDPESNYSWHGDAQFFKAGTPIFIESKNIRKKFSYAHDVSVHRVKFKWKLRHIAVEKILDTFVNKEKIAVLNYCVGEIDCYFHQPEPGVLLKRHTTLVSSRRVHNYVMELSLVLCKLFEPYIVLEIISWLPTISYISRYKKIAIIENVMRYIRSRHDVKDAISMRTRSKSLKTQ